MKNIILENAEGKKLEIIKDIASSELFWIDVTDQDGKTITTFPATRKQLQGMYR